ncbi:MAG: crossover junction endodeoxyribonuclease RuvC [Rickettsiales bacterium]|nr:crossover junction endodeoxyribonuclease RuvC [Rickettsiales bacterium]
MTIVLGIDPGLNNTGWGIVSCKNNNFKYINCGTIVNHHKIETHLKLKKIYDTLDDIIKRESPIECAIEETFVNKNPRLSLKLGYSKAIAILAATQNNLKIFEYTPRAIKKAFAGSGKADKDQMTGMLKYLLPTHEASSEHEADALALAICHINTESFKQILNTQL